METKEKVKKVVTVFLLNIVLPTVDIFTDLFFIVELLALDPEQEEIRWLREIKNLELNKINFKRIQFGIALLFFFLLNYGMTFGAWFRYEEDKSKTLVYPLFNIYPQLCNKS